MLGHKDAWLGHVQQLLLPVGMNGQLADHLAAQDPNDDLSEFAEELGVFEDTKTQAGLARNRDYEVAMSHGWQALDKVGRHLLSPALGTGWANSGLTTEWNCELDVASAAREASDSQIRVST